MNWGIESLGNEINCRKVGGRLIFQWSLLLDHMKNVNMRKERKSKTESKARREREEEKEDKMGKGFVERKREAEKE